MENKIGKLENQLEYQKEEFMKFKQILINQNSQQKNQIENQKNQIENMKNQIENQKNQIENQKIKMEYKSIEFQMKIKEVNEDINRLFQKINELQSQVDDLHQFNFQVMLRKLIKNLIEYLYNHYYPHFMHLNKFTNKVEFVRAPIIKEKDKGKEKLKKEEKEKLTIKKAEEIINALNRLLDIIFSNEKMRDYIVHFVEPNAKINFLNRRFIKVFSNPNKFFDYFQIDEKDKRILVEIIPSSYFMEIDNFKFDKFIKKLIHNYENRLLP